MQHGAKFNIQSQIGNKNSALKTFGFREAHCKIRCAEEPLCLHDDSFPTLLDPSDFPSIFCSIWA